MDEYQAVMFTTGLGKLSGYRFEVDAVVGKQGPTLSLSHFEEIGVSQPTQARIVRGGDNVVAALAEANRNLPADLLVEK
jgi:hypothetical protein